MHWNEGYEGQILYYSLKIDCLEFFFLCMIYMDNKTFFFKYIIGYQGFKLSSLLFLKAKKKHVLKLLTLHYDSTEVQIFMYNQV